jgi:hypothetical protein
MSLMTFDMGVFPHPIRYGFLESFLIYVFLVGLG